MRKLLATAALLVCPAAFAGQQSTAYTTYVTKPGDGLYSIARRFGTTPAELIRLNGIQNPDKLYRGMKLKVPLPPQKASAAHSEPTTSAPQKQTAPAQQTAQPVQPSSSAQTSQVKPESARTAGPTQPNPEVKTLPPKPAPAKTQASAQHKQTNVTPPTQRNQPKSFLPDYTAMQDTGGQKSILSLIGGVVLKLAFVIVLVYICAKAMRALSFRSYRGRSGGRMAILDSLALGPNRGLYIVRVAGRYLLLGVTNERIDVLSELPPDAVPDSAGSEGHFGGILDRLLGGDPAAPARVGSLLDRTADHLRRRAQETQEGTKSWES